MPDFEALIRHQQTRRIPANQCLKVVKNLPTSNSKPTIDGNNLSTLSF